MTLASRVTLYVAPDVAGRMEAISRATGELRQDVADAAIRSLLDAEEPAVLARIANEAAAELRRKCIAIPADGLRAASVRRHVEVPRLVGEGDRLVRAGEGYLWQRVSQEVNRG